MIEIGLHFQYLSVPKYLGRKATIFRWWFMCQTARPKKHISSAPFAPVYGSRAACYRL